MKLWYSYIAIAALILLGLFDLVNFGLTITTVSTFVIAILFIISKKKRVNTNKKK